MSTAMDSFPPSKRLRTVEGAAALVSYAPAATGPMRTSSLAHPTMKLSGHKGSVYACGYDTVSGEVMASAGFDMEVLLWNAASGLYENFNVCSGHKNAILDLKFYANEYIATASADKTLGWFSADTGLRVKKCQGHSRIVNAVAVAHTTAPLLCSASDDGTVLLWDMRVKKPTGVLEASSELEFPCAVTSVAYHFNQHTVYSGGIDNQIHAWDTRKLLKSMTLKGHEDTITYLSLNQQETHLLSNSMDGTLKSWDVRPYTTNPNTRLDKTFLGATHNAEKGLLKCAWSPDGSMVTCGSADRMVHIWDELSAEELYLLPGHNGCVNTVVFHPKQNVIASGSSDKTIYVGELGQ